MVRNGQNRLVFRQFQSPIDLKLSWKIIIDNENFLTTNFKLNFSSFPKHPKHQQTTKIKMEDVNQQTKGDLLKTIRKNFPNYQNSNFLSNLHQFQCKVYLIKHQQTNIINQNEIIFFWVMIVDFAKKMMM